MPPPPLDPVKVRATMEKAVDGFIRPGYETFRDKARALESTMQALCADPSANKMNDAKQGFADTVDAWSHIEIVRVGPVIEQNRFERILYYPDKKGLGLKQVQRYLADKDESVTTADGLKTKSVAAQGLGALEFVLYGTGAEALTARRMIFAAAMARRSRQSCQYWKRTGDDLDGTGRDRKELERTGPGQPRLSR